MSKLWLTYVHAFQARSLRERCIFILMLVAVLYVIFELFLFSPLKAKNAALIQRFELLKKENTALNAQEKVFSSALANLPELKKKEEIIRLKKDIDEKDKSIKEVSTGLVSAAALPEIIRDVLVEQKDIALLGMQAYAPEAWPLGNDNFGKGRPVENTAANEAALEKNDMQSIFNSMSLPSSQTNESESLAGIFKHRVVFRVRGSYFSIAHYLQRLESLDWRFYWSDLHYQVDNYPNAIAQVTVYTLSTEQGVLSE